MMSVRFKNIKRKKNIMTNAFTPQNAAMLLIDHQDGTMGWVRSASLDSIKMNTVAIAKAAVATEIPLILTASMEDQAQGPLFTELQEAAPESYKNRIQRAGVVDCMQDGGFAGAVAATDR